MRLITTLFIITAILAALWSAAAVSLTEPAASTQAPAGAIFTQELVDSLAPGLEESKVFSRIGFQPVETTEANALSCSEVICLWVDSTGRGLTCHFRSGKLHVVDYSSSIQLPSEKATGTRK